jgi:3,4-dihydroxy 2-butanone 4-phosphate synthase/GTP cyclohydrolase II
MPISPIQEIIEDLRRGRMVILVDDEDRENEGDLVMAAELVQPEDVNFMATFGRGLICLTLLRDRCEQLKLPLMVSDTDAKHMTNFTVSIEAAQGVTTGISAADRARTVQAAVAPDAGPDDIVMPGHVFPLMAQPGGVLTRAGHTEAGCDLARLAGFAAASVIVEILNEDGTMARRPDLELFAEKHGLKIGTITDLIRYRIENERTVERVAECRMPTEFGDFRLMAYLDAVEQSVHLAMVRGDVTGEIPVLTRVHVSNMLCDLFDAYREDCAWSLRKALARIAAEGRGVIVILARQQEPKELVRRLRSYQLLDRGVKLPEHTEGDELRGYGVGAQILADLGVGKMRVLGTVKKLHGLSGFGLEVTEYVSSE